MMPITRTVAVLLLVVPLLAGAAPSGQEAPDDKTLSPYFFVKSDDPAVDQLPLKSTSADVRIAGVIAEVRVTQVYTNEGKRPIEAIYVFPASTRAAVYGMRMTIGERVIEAKIDRRAEARRRYEEARDQGRSASLLEQQRPNVFQMNVANIMPGDEISVDLRYTEALVPTDRVYEFVHPAVVGPRYSNQAAETAPASEHWVSNPYLHSGEAPTYRFDISVSLTAGMPIKDITCTSHKVVASYAGPSIATVKLDGEPSGGNRDYVLRYRLAGDRIESGLLLYQGEENFFLLMMEPPKRIVSAAIPPREYIFIVDVSGSMHGFPLEISKKLLKDLIGNLRPTDRFNVLLFSGGSSLMAAESLPANRENIQRAIHVIERETGGGGTELLPALRRAITLPRPEGFSRTVVIATDGYVHVEEEAFDLIRTSLGKANMFAFGIGSGVNRHLIEGMARVGLGEPFVITKPDEAPAQAERLRKMIQSPVLTGIQLELQGFDTYDVEPVSIPDVMADRPVAVFGKWRGVVRGRIRLSGLAGGGSYAETIDLESIKPSKNNDALRYLWARQRIALLSDYNRLRPDDGRVKEVTDLGLKYSLLTAYTSFVATDTEVRNRTGEQTTVKQPLPLPEGVADYAVGGGLLRAQAQYKVAMPSLAEPEASRGFAGVREELALDTSSRAADRRTVAGSPPPLATHPTFRPGAKSPVISAVTVPAGLSKADVRSVMEKHLAEIGACVSRAGEMIVELVIGKDGSVKGVKILKSALQDSNTVTCITGQLRTIVFSTPSSARDATVRITLAFNS